MSWTAADIARGDRLLDTISSLLATKDYEWARDTLEGIRDTVERKGWATLRQEEAVTHVITGRLKHDLGS